MRARLHHSLILRVLAGVAVTCTPIDLLAQTTDEPTNVALDRWRPGLDLESVLGVETGSPQLLDSFDAWLKAGYASSLLLVHDDGDTGSLVGHRVYSHLGGSMTVSPRLQVGVNLPVALYQGRGGQPTRAFGPLEDLTAGGIGDLSFIGKVGLLSADQALVNVAALAALSVPTRLPREAYLGQSNVTATAGGAVSRQIADLRLAANLAYHWRPAVRFLDAKIGHEVRLSAGAAYDLQPITEIPIEAAVAWHMATRADAPLHRINESPSELMVEATYLEWLPIAVNAGFAIGVTAGVGTPSVRIFAGGRWAERPGDRDGDRIPDRVDDCPNKKEDHDGYEDIDGCPDLDNDEDGIPDVRDECPEIPESKNDFQDKDGCPEDVEAVLKGSRISLSEAVLFESGKAILKPRSKSLLNKVASLLKKNPQIGAIRIEGHTDNQGTEEDNLVLSQNRADAVRRYLGSQGVKLGRLTAKGFGESKPVASNKTARGRALNRRVEFIVEGIAP